MYCVIQEIETKRFNEHGYFKELKVSSTSITISGITSIRYYFDYGGGKFHRPVRKAYKVSIHESYREDGKVKKKQFPICTINYYDLAADWVSLYDYADMKISIAADALNVNPEAIYSLIEGKLQPVVERIKAEFAETEEYRVHQEHKGITTTHALNKSAFADKYGCDMSEYDYCFDVFGTLRNPDYLEKVKREHEYRNAYEDKGRSYQESYHSNYGGHNNGGGYSEISSSTYGENQNTLKKFYRTLSKAYHPDSNPDKDTSEEMKLLNQLKSIWGV